MCGRALVWEATDTCRSMDVTQRKAETIVKVVCVCLLCGLENEENWTSASIV